MLIWLIITSLIIGGFCLWLITKTTSPIPIYILSILFLANMAVIGTVFKYKVSGFFSKYTLIILGISGFSIIILSLIIRRFYTWMMLAGTLTNVTAVLFNNNKMPVFENWGSYFSTTSRYSMDDFHTVLNHQDKFKAFCDIILINLPLSSDRVSICISIGDILILTGTLLLLVYYITLCANDFRSWVKTKNG